MSKVDRLYIKIDIAEYNDDFKKNVNQKIEYRRTK